MATNDIEPKPRPLKIRSCRYPSGQVVVELTIPADVLAATLIEPGDYVVLHPIRTGVFQVNRISPSALRKS